MTKHSNSESTLEHNSLEYLNIRTETSWLVAPCNAQETRNGVFAGLLMYCSIVLAAKALFLLCIEEVYQP